MGHQPVQASSLAATNVIVQKILADAARDIERRAVEEAGLRAEDVRVASFLFTPGRTYHKTSWSKPELVAVLLRLLAMWKRKAMN
jgi:hypothetical protein